MAAAFALFCAIFALLGVQMALGNDPAIGDGSGQAKAPQKRHHQKAQGGGQPVVPPAQDQPAEPQYADPQQEYYDRPNGDDGDYGGYDQAQQGYDQGQQYPLPDYQQQYQPPQQQYQPPQQQYAPPVQSGTS